MRHIFNRETWNTQRDLCRLTKHRRHQIFVAQVSEGAVSLGIRIEFCYVTAGCREAPRRFYATSNALLAVIW